MKMNHIIASKQCPDRCKHRIDNGIKAFILKGGDRYDPDPIVVFPNRTDKLLSRHMPAPAVIGVNPVPLFHHSSGKLIDNDLHAPFPGRNALMPDHGDLQAFAGNRRKPFPVFGLPVHMPQKGQVSAEISWDQPDGILQNTVEPFQAKFLHPAGRPLYRSCMKIKGCSHPDHDPA